MWQHSEECKIAILVLVTKQTRITLINHNNSLHVWKNKHADHHHQLEAEETHMKAATIEY